jgi:DNA repair protein SbcD/Mre11
MRLLHTADWHLGRNLEQFSRLDEQAAFLDELAAICDRENVDMLLVCGDVFDTYNPPAAAETLYYDAIERLSDHGRRAVVIIAGNHDNPDRLAAAAPLACLQGIFILGYPASDASDLIGRQPGGPALLEAAGPGYIRIRLAAAACPVVVLTLPYPSESRLAQLASPTTDEEEQVRSFSAKIGRWLHQLADEHFSDSTINLAAAHFFVQGGWPSESERTLQLGTAMLVDPAALPASAQYFALGHLHRPQAVSGSACPARYAGSPLAYSFSESGYTKSVCLVDVQPGQPADVRLITLQSGKPLRRWIAREGLAQALAWCREGRDRGCWIDLELHDSQLPASAEIKALHDLQPGLVYIRPVLTGTAEVALTAAGRSSRKIDELFAEFYRFRYGSPVPEDVLATFVELVNQAPEEPA